MDTVKLPYVLATSFNMSLLENFHLHLGKYMTQLAKEQKSLNKQALFRVYFEWDKQFIVREVRLCSPSEIKNTKDRYFYPLDKYGKMDSIGPNEYMIIFCECIPTDEEGRLHSLSPNSTLSKFTLTPACKPVYICNYSE